MDDTSRAIQILDSLSDASQFMAQGSCPLELPGIEVNEVGEVSLPVSAAAAEKLIKAADQAPYGRGEETIVDTDVRRVWQIEPDKITFHNQNWRKVVGDIAKSIGVEFGLPATPTATFYKLLVYDKGSFFKPHRDTEKQDRMFATLVITLPSRHKGGRLLVRHDGLEKEVRFDDKQAQYEIRYAAFYADCEHEVEPVESGYRVNLVYNLSLPKRKAQPSAPQHQKEVEELSRLMVQRFKTYEKLALPLSHQYSEAGIQDGLFKGSDRTRINLLKRVAEQLNLDVHLATMVRWQSGYPDYNTISHDFGYSRRYRRSEPDYSNAEWEEVFDESTQLECWHTIDGHSNDLGVMKLSESEFLSTDSLDDLPYTQEINEATGNEGISMERWYRQTVVVLWPKSNSFQILAGQGGRASVPRLRELINEGFDDGAADRLELSNAIVDHWKPPMHRYGYMDDDHAIATEFAELITEVADLKLAKRYLKEVIGTGCHGVEGPAVARLAEKLVWSKLGTSLQESVAKQVPSTDGADLKNAVALVHGLCVTTTKDAKRPSVLKNVLAELQTVIEKWDKYRDERFTRRDRGRDGIIEQLFVAFDSVGDSKGLSEFLAYALSKKKYDLHKVLIPAVKSLASDSERLSSASRKCLEQLRQHCIACLESLTSKAPNEPTHWAQKINIKCDCEDCERLQIFLHDKHEKVCRFKVRKDRRKHLHRQIDDHKCDLDHTTNRSGSPQTLVCTKNRASFKAGAKAYKANLEILRELRAFD